MTQDELLILLAVIPILLAQSIFLFIDARKREHYPWFWGLWGLIQAPMPLIVYMLVVRKIWKHWRRKA
jgi:hypothetical protein